MPDRTQPEPVQLFYSYAHEDGALREKLDKHLSLLRQQGLLSTWYDRDIQAGEEWKQTIDEHLNTASLTLLLISPDFMDSDYCYSIEMKRAMERHERGEAYVIPVILRPVDWQGAPFSKLKALPTDAKAVTTWENIDEAFLDVEHRLRELIEHLPIARRSSAISASALQNREAMLQRLGNMYKDLLADSLQEVAWIELDLAVRPGAVENTANLILHREDQTESLLPAGTSILQVYQDANQQLLLLGEPGVGKSTLLYHLGRHLVIEAGQQPTHPLPFLFPLSSWAEQRLPLDDWMVEQLCSPLYLVPREVSQQWVQGEQILPLLDGLDEMEEASRPACITAINAYLLQHLHPLVVCSRSAEYAAASIHKRLTLQSAVVVLPLSAEQLGAILIQAGTPFAGLRSELKQNTELRELASNPLWLNVLLLTFKGTPILALPQRRSELQQHLFQRYVERMVARKGDSRRYPLGRTTRWLSWLAGQMRERNQTVFAVEMFQPSWLERQPRVFYHWSMELVFGLGFGLIGELVFGQAIWMLIGLGFGLLVGLVVNRRDEITLAERVIWSWKETLSRPLDGVVYGLVSGLGSLLVGWRFGGLVAGLAAGLVAGLFVGLCSALGFGLKPNQYIDRQALSPGEGPRRSAINGLVFGLLSGLVGGLVGGLVVGLLSGLIPGLGAGLGIGLIVGLGNGLGNGLGAALQHLLVRFWLSQAGVFPLDAGNFLDDARARHLLQCVGGSYRFVHRLLMDYFADLDGPALSSGNVVSTQETSPGASSASLHWRVKVCRWLWRVLGFVWGTLIVGIVITTIANLNTTTSGTPFAKLYLVHLAQTYPLPVWSGLGLLAALTLLSWLGSRDKQVTPARPLSEGNRIFMLQRLRLIYKALLEQSLEGAIQMELDLASRPAAVQNAVSLYFRLSDQQEQLLSHHTSIREVYTSAQHELLILGEPGAGKSTLLYHLGHHLVIEAGQQPTHPLPFLFPLSSWAEQRLPLDDWMVEQLCSPLYLVPREVSQQLVQGEQILPLLDGLDEMETSARAACIAAINIYHREHLQPLVVCSRTNEYEAASQRERLVLSSAVVIRPLTAQQVDSYLTQMGKPLTALHKALREDPGLQELGMTPLLLKTLILAYEKWPVNETWPRLW
jgi:GTPase SAR1 family protein